MLIESTRIRHLLNTTVCDATVGNAVSDEERQRQKPPATYELSLNPLPALVILLLGIMMSSHQQSTMTSNMVHKQWGNLLSGASLARGLTYVIMFLRPPESTLPSRPPTELLAAFGLIAGGIIFMASVSMTNLKRPWRLIVSDQLLMNRRAPTPSPEWCTTSWTPCSCSLSPWGSWVC